MQTRDISLKLQLESTLKWCIWFHCAFSVTFFFVLSSIRMNGFNIDTGGWLSKYFQVFQLNFRHCFFSVNTIFLLLLFHSRKLIKINWSNLSNDRFKKIRWMKTVLFLLKIYWLILFRFDLHLKYQFTYISLYYNGQ